MILPTGTTPIPFNNTDLVTLLKDVEPGLDNKNKSFSLTSVTDALFETKVGLISVFNTTPLVPLKLTDAFVVTSPVMLKLTEEAN